MPAYQTGKAAKVAPPATISHTSLPSHQGPMAFRMVDRDDRPGEVVLIVDDDLAATLEV
jgi:hypothetical protein